MTKKAIQLRSRLSISRNIKMNELIKYQIDQIEQMIAQDHLVHWKLGITSRHRRIHFYFLLSWNSGSPLRGQRTHTNSRTARKLIWK